MLCLALKVRQRGAKPRSCLCRLVRLFLVQQSIGDKRASAGIAKPSSFLEVENRNSSPDFIANLRQQRVIEVIGNVCLLEPCRRNQLWWRLVCANHRIPRWRVSTEADRNRNRVLRAVS